MFDFTNSTFSAILTILSMIFGMAYPLIIGCIEKIDTKYRSTILVNRFKNEFSFQTFRFLLPVNLAIAIILPFILDDFICSRLLISVQSILVLIQMVITLRLFSRIMVYYNIVDINNDILEEYHRHKNKREKKKEALSFMEWTELAYTLQVSSDENLINSIKNEIEMYVKDFNRENGDTYHDYDPYFYLAITRINEMLCKNEFSFTQSNSFNYLVTALISVDNLKISRTTYVYMWKNLKIQLYYHKYGRSLNLPWKSSLSF